MDTPPTALKSARGVPSELPAMLMVLGWCMQASAAGAELIHVRTVSAIQTAWSDRAPHGQHARRQCSAADGAAIARGVRPSFSGVPTGSYGGLHRLSEI